MALTRGDKMIIAGAAALAVTVVLGLAVVKKPYLFGLGDKPAPADIPPAPTAAAPETPAGPPPITAPPAAIAKPAASAAAPAPVAAPMPAATPAPDAAPTPTAPTPVPATPAAPSAKTPPAQVAGDESLEKMFEELAGESGGNKAAKPGAAKDEAKAAAPAPAIPAAPAATTPAEGIKAEALPEPQAAPAPGHDPAPAKTDPKAEAKAKAEQAKAEAKAKAEQAKAEAKAKAEQAKANPAPKPVAPAAPAAARPVAGGGNVIRVTAEEKPGEYVLVIQTNKPPANFSRMFMTDPPRLVLDIDGAWNYNGPLSSSTGDAFIRQIRVGKHADKFRVVLDMAPDATTRLRGAPTAERVPEGVALRIPK